MKNRIAGITLNPWLSLVFVALMFSSCRSHKDLSYLRDAENNKVLSGTPVPSTEYKIQVNDNLYVSIVTANAEMNEIYNPATIGSQRAINNIWQNLPGQFIQGYLVETDGTVNLPALGKVPVAGLTIRESEAKIKTKAQEYLKDVTAKVRLLNYKITVVGEVTNPGVYYNYNYEFTVFDALSSAGGIKNTSKLDKVLVLRRTKSGTQEYLINLQSSSALKSPGYLLEPNDVVVVQPSRYKNLELRLPIYTAALSTVTTFLLVLNYISNN
jgi:polysaccharide biosynthesis/export protein